MTCEIKGLLMVISEVCEGKWGSMVANGYGWAIRGLLMVMNELYEGKWGDRGSRDANGYG